MLLKPGDRLGRFELLELLGRGGMGEVYRAQDTVLRRRVALKVLHPSAEGSTGGTSNATDGAARILREARAAAGIEHPNAVAIYDVGEVDGVPFLAMEYVPGRPLRAFIRDAAVPLSQRISWLVEIAGALGAAHDLGIVHRDVKPENVMVRDDGRAKVLDFGIARREVKVDPSGPTGALGETLTADGKVVGTPFYMAPEQMRGESLDGRADQFAWGVLAYELLTGELPWDRDAGALALVAQVLTGEIVPARTRNAEIPAVVDGVIGKALSKTASSRFGGMVDILDALEPYAARAGASTGRTEARRSRADAEEMSFAPTQHVARSAAPGAAAAGRTPIAVPAHADSPKRAALGRGVFVAVVAAGVVFAVGRLVSPRHRAEPTVRDAAVAPAAESRMSSSAEATEAYRAGVQSIRDASLQIAKTHFDRAIQLDSGFAAAHLMRAMLPTTGVTTEMRQDLLDANNAREALGELHRVMLDALQPWTLLPPDAVEFERRSGAALKRYRSNAELQFLLGYELSDGATRTAAMDAAIASDPGFASAWRIKARDLASLGDAAGALSAYGRCLELSPGSMTCLEDLAMLEAREGKCEDMANTSRRMIAIAPSVANSYFLLAQALLGAGQPIEAARGALQQEWDRFSPSERKHELAEEAALAILTGDFDGAKRWHQEWEKEVASAPSRPTHFYPAYEQMLLDLEVGRNVDALERARTYLARQSAWQANDFEPEHAIYAYAVQVAAGGLPEPRLDALRDRWLASDEERTKRRGDRDKAAATWHWSAGYALFVATPAEATEALEHRPAVLVGTARALVGEPIGRAYLLAGAVDDARSVLTRVTRSCLKTDFVEPVFSTWAAFDLGQTLEALRDPVGACAAYRVVIDRWGTAKPPSRTATKARARVLALRCAG